MVDVPERIGAGVQISARAANAADDEAAYELSPLTRWILGHSGGIDADSRCPAGADFRSRSFSDAGWRAGTGRDRFRHASSNTVSITAGTYTFHFYDEVNGAAPLTLATAIGATDTSIAFGATFATGSPAADRAGDRAGDRYEYRRQLRRSRAGFRALRLWPLAAARAAVLVYSLSESVLIVPFIKEFFGSPASGDWKYNIALPNVRLASVELYMTNALGDGAVAANSYTETIDSGLRTMAGGQYSFQISGYLAIQTSAAPAVDCGCRPVREGYLWHRQYRPRRGRRSFCN